MNTSKLKNLHFEPLKKEIFLTKDRNNKNKLFKTTNFNKTAQNAAFSVTNTIPLNKEIFTPKN
jgi:hypothetical protein